MPELIPFGLMLLLFGAVFFATNHWNRPTCRRCGGHRIIANPIILGNNQYDSFPLCLDCLMAAQKD